MNRILRDIPLPTCCEDAKRWPAVRFNVDVCGEREPYWSVNAHDFILRETGYPEQIPPAHFCPFCGTSLPKMVLKIKPPARIAKATDGGYYCDTCERRLGDCRCRLPESAYEPAAPNRSKEP